MSDRSVCIVVTARASYARVKTVIEALREHGHVRLDVLAAGSAAIEHYGRVLDDEPTWTGRIFSVLEGANHETMAAETGLLATRLAHEFARLRPNVVLTIADRHETIATAIAASYQNIPLAHLQGGEWSGSIDHKVRNAVSMLAEWHFPATWGAYGILTECLNVRGRVVMTGCPSVDLAARIGPREAIPDAERRIVVLHHAVTTESRGVEEIRALEDAVTAFDRPILWLWPNQDAGAGAMEAEIRQWHPDGRIEFRRHLPAEDFLRAIRDCACLVGNSSVGIRESSYLGVPVVNVGNRQQHRERAGNVTDVDGLRVHALAEAIAAQVAHGPYAPSELYGDGKAGARVARLLEEAAGVSNGL